MKNSKLYFLTLIVALAFTVVACTPKEQQEAANILTEDSDEAIMDGKEDAMMKGDAIEDEVIMKDGDSMEGDKIMDDAEAMKKDEDSVMRDKEVIDQDSDSSALIFSGKVLAGTFSPLLEFNQADYDKALGSDKVVFLYFYANWCPICKAEFPKMQQAFNQLTTSGAVGFRVNFNDSQTTDQEKALAKQFGVAYQHTKVAIKNSTRVLKAPDSWSTQRYLDEINKLTN